MTSKVERAAGPLRENVREIATILDLDEAQYRCLYAPRVARLGFRLEPTELRERAAWALVSQWLVAYAIGAIDRGEGLAEAESWFHDGLDSLPRIAPDARLLTVTRTLTREDAYALLPYLLDPLGPGTRRAVLENSRLAEDRRARKAAGVFYTPADLAQHMANAVAASSARACLDPACGSGVFLRAARASCDNTEGPSTFGCDLSPLAAEQCAFVLLASELREQPRAAPWSIWHLHRLNLATVDSLLLRPGSELTEVERHMRRRDVDRARESLNVGQVPTAVDDQQPPAALGDLFPDLARGCDVLLCNPPYAQLGNHRHGAEIAHMYDSFAEKPPSAASRISIPFVEHAWRLSREACGRAAVVVPLSCAFNRSAHYRGLRRAMATQSADWRFAFFDRAPDALFGDDVKTRNAVLLFDAAGADGIKTTSLLRMTSRNRKRVLASIRYADLGDIEIDELIPKLGSAPEVRLYKKVRSLPGLLENSVSDFERVLATGSARDNQDHSVYVAPTAYNWFNCARSLTASRGGELSTAGVTRVGVASAVAADAAYALLSSRLVFWLWCVEGDAFHVTRHFLRTLPFELATLDPTVLRELATLGAELWSALSEHPTMSVNKGRRTFAFPSQDERELVGAIDRSISDGFGVRSETDDVDLGAWYERVVDVERSLTNRDLPKALRGVPTNA